MSSDIPDFLSEAQEIVESFSRDLLAIEAQQKQGAEFDPELLNSAFRSIHTLKGLSALSGGGGIKDVSHALENRLDDLRLGRYPVNRVALDLLFEAVEIYGRMMSDAASGNNYPDYAKAFAVSLRAGFGPLPDADSEVALPPPPATLEWLDDALLQVLTEYEEHRLRENLRHNKTIYRIHASFPIMEIDTGIEELKGKLKKLGEVVTYLPSVESSSEDHLDLDILLGSKASKEEVQNASSEPALTVEVLQIPSLSSSGIAAEEPSEPAPGSAPASSSSPAPPASEAKASPAAESAAPSPASSGDISNLSPLKADESSAANSQAVAEMSLRSVSQTVRVDLRRLDGLMTWVGELGVVFANFSEFYEQLQHFNVPGDTVRGVRDELRTMERRLNSLREGILEVRMVPLGQVFDRLARVVRKLGRESGKEIRLEIRGAETELDKLIMEELSDPLMHMVRNSIDHGIETPGERLDNLKDPVGCIELRAYQKGNRVVIEIADDGRGMDWQKIRDKAVDRGFVDADEAADLSPRQCLNLIFQPGLSTRGEASELSGRGVGMDVVKTNIARLSGMIDIHSELGKGSCFSITLPVTLALIQALVVRVSAETYCIPLASVIESMMLEPSEIETIEGHPVIRLRGRTLPLIHISDIFDLPRSSQNGSPGSSGDLKYVVVVGSVQHWVGLVVDDLLGQRDVVIKPLGRALGRVPGIAGATELRAKHTVLLLDVTRLVNETVEGIGAKAA